MRANNPHNMVLTIHYDERNIKQLGVILDCLADTCSLKHSPHESHKCNDEMKPLETLHKNRVSQCARRAPSVTREMMKADQPTRMIRRHAQSAAPATSRTYAAPSPPEREDVWPLHSISLTSIGRWNKHWRYRLLAPGAVHPR